MWKRLFTLMLVSFTCVSAASEAPPPSAAAAEARPTAGVERIGLLPAESRRANELETSFPDDAIVRIGDGDARSVGAIATRSSRERSASSSSCWDPV
jgi:hypothetical protein